MNCKICFEKFDNTRFMPVICIPCAHTFCSTCVTHIKECSICRTKISEKKPNFSMLEILEEKPQIRPTISPQLKTATSSLTVTTEPSQSGSKLSPQALKLKNEGIKLYEEKKFYGASQKFNDAIKICFDDAEKSLLFCLKANALRECSNFQGALVFYNKVLMSFQTSHEEKKKIGNQMSVCLKEQGIRLNKAHKHQLALKKLEKAIEQCSDDYEDKYLLFWLKAKTLKATGNTEESKLFYEFAIEIAPSDKKEEVKDQMKYNLNFH